MADSGPADVTTVEQEMAADARDTQEVPQPKEAASEEGTGDAAPNDDASQLAQEVGNASLQEAADAEGEAGAMEGAGANDPGQSQEQSALDISTRSSGARAGKGPRVILPTNPTPDLQFLTFQSWWTELKTKRYMEICFDMKSELFQVIIDKDVQHLSSEQLFNSSTESIRDVTAKDTKVMSMHLHEKLSGNQHAESLRRPHLCQWDLHVGAKLNILGRPTTLMQCSLLTGQWLDYQAARLTKIKSAFEEQLRKYETIPVPSIFATKKTDKRKAVGSTDLRFLLNMIEGLQQRLAQYRPTVAAAIGELVQQK